MFAFGNPIGLEQLCLARKEVSVKLIKELLMTEKQTERNRNKKIRERENKRMRE